MRPTFAEQLRGLRRILDVAVAPALTDDYAAEALQGVQRALAMLEARVHEVVPFLVWDNAATALLLTAIEPHVALDGPVTPAAPVDPHDVTALDAENERLRGLLAGAIPALSTGDGATRDVYAEVVAHLRARIARYPYTLTGTLPSR